MDKARPVVVASGTATCPECAHAWQQVRRTIGTEAADLVELGADFRPAASLPKLSPSNLWLAQHRVTDRKVTAADKVRVYNMLAGLCIKRKLPTGWLMHRFKDVFGVWPGPATKAASVQSAAIADKRTAERDAKALPV